jgi:hypothetical protein
MNKLGIRNQIKGLLARNDTTDSIIDNFIDMAVAKIQRTLRVPAMEKMLITTAAAEEPQILVLPNDFLRLKHLYLSNASRNWPIEYKDVTSFMQMPDAPGNTPKYYTRVQGTLLLKPAPAAGTQITMVYYGEIPDLVADTDSSWLSDIAPDLLIYTALAFAADYYIDDRKEAFSSVAEQAFRELLDQAYEIEMAQEGLVVSTSYAGPEY